MLAVFAGTSEGRELCEALSAAGVRARAFTATEYGATLIDELPYIEVHAGRLDARKIAEALGQCDVAIDATHPYAAVVSAHIREAAEQTGTRYVRIVRPRLALEPDAPFGAQTAFDDELPPLTEVASPQEAVTFLNGHAGAVLLTTGSKDLAVYAGIASCADRVWARFLPSANSITEALALGYARAHLICMQGPFSHELNVALLRMSGARWLVTKDTGSAGGFDTKISAAAELGVHVVLIRRPLEDEQGISLPDAIAEFARPKP